MRPPLKLSTLLLLAALGALAPLGVQAETRSTEGKHLLWSVQGKGGGTLHLLGSVHIGDASLYPLPAVMEQAFDSAEVVVVEADTEGTDPSKTQALLLTEGMLADGSTLKDHVPAKTYAAVARSAGEAGLPMVALDRMRPWLAAVTLMGVILEKAGLTGAYGIERHFLGKARGKKPIAELESVMEQLKLFAGFNEKEQAAFLTYTLDDLKLLTVETQKLLTAWKAGDTAYLEKILLEVKNTPGTQAIYRVLFAERNTRMLKKLDGYLASGKRHFVIVGAAHLVGEDGLVARLKKHGHTVTRR